MKERQGLRQWGGGDHVIKGLAVEQPVVLVRLQLGDGGFEADVEVSRWGEREVAGEATVAFAVVEALSSGDGQAGWADDGGGEGLDLSAAGGGDGLVERGVTQGEILGTVIDAAIGPAFGGAATAEPARFFEEDWVESCGVECAGGGDAGKAGADDGNAFG